MAKKRLPKVIYVTNKEEADGTRYLWADTNLANLVEMGEVVEIGVYKLQEAHGAKGVVTIDGKEYNEWDATHG